MPTKSIPDQIQQKATVTIGKVPFDDFAGKFVEPQNPVDIYTDYKIINRYEKDKHTYMMGITSPDGFQGNSVAFVQLAAPTLLWICDWTTARWNTQPQMPNSEEVKSDWVLLDEHYEPVMIIVAPDGVTPLYRISGTFIYGHRKPDSTTLRDLSYAKPPWLDDFFDRTVPTKLTVNNLIESKQVAGSSFPGKAGNVGKQV